MKCWGLLLLLPLLFSCHDAIKIDLSVEEQQWRARNPNVIVYMPARIYGPNCDGSLQSLWERVGSRIGVHITCKSIEKESDFSMARSQPAVPILVMPMYLIKSDFLTQYNLTITGPITLAPFFTLTREGDGLWPLLKEANDYGKKQRVLYTPTGHEATKIMQNSFPIIVKHYNDLRQAVSALKASKADVVEVFEYYELFYRDIDLSGVQTDESDMLDADMHMLITPKDRLFEKMLLRSLSKETVTDKWLAFNWAYESHKTKSTSTFQTYRIFEHYKVGVVLFLSLCLITLLLIVWIALLQRKGRLMHEHFQAVLTHELRAPLQSMEAGLSLLGQTLLSDTQKIYLSQSLMARRDLLDLIKNTLDLLKEKHHGWKFKFVPCDITATANNIVVLYRHDAETSGLSLALKHAQIPVLMLDELRIKQLLHNLLSNALKFTKTGGIDIFLSYEGNGDDKGELRIVVADTGLGITMGEKRKLFRKFSQANRNIHRDYGGSGLGLMFCKQLVTGMGGAISLDSQPGKGTTVTIVLPVSRGALPEEAIQDTPVRDLYEDLKVLLVEDNQLNQQAITMQLQCLGIQRDLASDGQEALRLFKETPHYDLVLLDCDLPDLNGYDVARFMREHEASSEKMPTPIVSISGHVGTKHEMECLASGMNGLLSAPITLQDLQCLVNVWLATTCEQKTSVVPEHTSMRNKFFEHAEQDFSLAKQALMEGFLPQASYHFHRIYGSAMVVNLTSVASQAKHLEEAARNGKMIEERELCQLNDLLITSKMENTCP